MGAKGVFAILLMHAWMEVVLTAGVPSKFLGLWEGATTADDGRAWNASIAIIGGPFDSTIASMQIINEDSSCAHRIKLATKDGKNRPNENEDAFNAKTDRVISSDPSPSYVCFLGEFKFEALRSDRALVDIVWRLEARGKVVEEWSFVLTRVDAGSTAEAIDSCSTKPRRRSKKRGF